MSCKLGEAVLDCHGYLTPGKTSVTPTKPAAAQRDLAHAYSLSVTGQTPESAQWFNKLLATHQAFWRARTVRQP